MQVCLVNFHKTFESTILQRTRLRGIKVQRRQRSLNVRSRLGADKGAVLGAKTIDEQSNWQTIRSHDWVSGRVELETVLWGIVVGVYRVVVPLLEELAGAEMAEAVVVVD